jgi:DNA-directed RNA polymerase specialized sigma subunit
MSIAAEEFDKHKNPLKYIVAFLRTHRDRAYTDEFIAKEIRIDISEVRNALLWNSLAQILDAAYGSLIDSATVGGILYYRYKGL